MGCVRGLWAAGVYGRVWAYIQQMWGTVVCDSVGVPGVCQEWPFPTGHFIYGRVWNEPLTSEQRSRQGQL